MSALKPLQIDVVSDVVCPWCYIGKHRIESALALVPDVPVKLQFRGGDRVAHSIATLRASNDDRVGRKSQQPRIDHSQHRNVMLVRDLTRDSTHPRRSTVSLCKESSSA